MTTYQQTEIETILAVLERKQIELRAYIETISGSLLDNHEPFSTNTKLESALRLTAELTSILDTLTILNNDRR